MRSQRSSSEAPPRPSSPTEKARERLLSPDFPRPFVQLAFWRLHFLPKIIDRNIANRAIATPIKGVVPHPGATLPYSEFNGFNKSPTTVRLGPDLELSSTVCVAINTIFYSLRSVYFVYHSAVNIRILSYRSIVILKL